MSQLPLDLDSQRILTVTLQQTKQHTHRCVTVLRLTIETKVCSMAQFLEISTFSKWLS